MLSYVCHCSFKHYNTGLIFLYFDSRGRETSQHRLLCNSQLSAREMREIFHF